MKHMAIKSSIKSFIKTSINSFIRNIPIFVLLLTLFIILTVMFNIHANYNGGGSDLPSQIKAAIHPTEEAYTITKPIFAGLYFLFNSNIGIAIFLALTVVLTIITTYFLLKHLLPNSDKSILWVFSIICNFVIAIYIPFLNPNMNYGLQEGTEWHNATYICMKLFGLLSILTYLKIKEHYLQQINIKQWILFSLLLIITVALKPNFIFAFAPAMLVLLIIDLFKTKGKGIKSIIIFGLAVIPSLFVILYQNEVLFASNTNEGIGISFASLLRMYAKNPIASLFQSIAFPLAVLVINLKELIKDKKYLFFWIVWLFGFLEYIFLQETGSRAAHGNFEWGYSFCIFAIFIASAWKLYNNTLAWKLYNNTLDQIFKKPYIIFCYALLGYHFICGILYFIKVFPGADFS